MLAACARASVTCRRVDSSWVADPFTVATRVGDEIVAALQLSVDVGPALIANLLFVDEHVVLLAARCREHQRGESHREPQVPSRSKRPGGMTLCRSGSLTKGEGRGEAALRSLGFHDLVRTKGGNDPVPSVTTLFYRGEGLAHFARENRSP